MQLTPKELYHLEVKERGLIHDDAQFNAVCALHRLYEQLLAPPPAPAVESSLFSFFKRKQAVEPLSGVYLWGGVGRGKTYLIDSFFSCLPFKDRRRIHFQRFMKEVHGILKTLPKVPDPMPIVAKRFADTARLICLDEFHVDDVADAMLLAGLLHGLQEEGVVLVYTSNIEPDELYLNGLQRQRFLPAIELIKNSNQVVHLDSPTDYRLSSGISTQGFYMHDNEKTVEMFKEIIAQKAQGDLRWSESITINQRALNTVAYSQNIIWLSFTELCGSPKSYYDYLVISEQYKTIMLSNIPEMNSGMDDVANRFIQLIDALYDQGNELIVSAAVALPQLYRGQRLAFPFQRTQSRLTEMFGESYRKNASTRSKREVGWHL